MVVVNCLWIEGFRSLRGAAPQIFLPVFLPLNMPEKRMLAFNSGASRLSTHVGHR